MDKPVFVGKWVEQVRCEAPEYQKFVGRQGTVDQEIEDEKGEIHCHTFEDGIWCPSKLLSVIE